RNRPEHPAFATPGEYRTDDLGRLDADGVLSIVGRADEAITTGGLTVVPQVVEAAILTDPAVAECAVLGVPDERLGERVVAVVVAASGAVVTSERVRAKAAEHVDRTAVPRDIFIVDELPRRGPGKVDKNLIRRQIRK
ncbi:MAG: O-succinylbenzoic acid--CoA ligase, partial [Williamsia sp.]|nr:O-succinylbenzoic acid--CoA ligase [Williamsia sp.]